MNITILGSGVFGVAIANSLANNKDNKITIWTPDDNFMKKSKENKLLFGEEVVTKQKNILVTDNIIDSIKKAEIIFILVASKYIEQVLNEIKEQYNPNIPIFIGSKGLLDNKPYYPSKMVKKVLKAKKIAFFAGPNLAKDLLNNAYMNITIGSKEKQTFKLAKKIFPSNIQLEYLKEIEALELASILKNIYAIGSGMYYQKSPCSSTIYSYLTKAYKECMQILYYLKDYPDEEIYAGLLGDFFFTGASINSRNFSYGKLLNETKKEATLFLKNETVEGYNSLKNLNKIIKKINNFPILNEIFEVINN